VFLLDLGAQLGSLLHIAIREHGCAGRLDPIHAVDGVGVDGLVCCAAHAGRHARAGNAVEAERTRCSRVGIAVLQRSAAIVAPIDAAARVLGGSVRRGCAACAACAACSARSIRIKRFEPRSGGAAGAEDADDNRGPARNATKRRAPRPRPRAWRRCRPSCVHKRRRPPRTARAASIRRAR